jgi:hypothetical protein
MTSNNADRIKRLMSAHIMAVFSLDTHNADRIILKKPLRQFLEEWLFTFNDVALSLILDQIYVGFSVRLRSTINDLARTLTHGFARTYFDKHGLPPRSVLEIIHDQMLWFMWRLYGHAVQDAFQRLGQTASLRTIRLLILRYLPPLSEAKTFETTPFPSTPADAHKFLAAFVLPRKKDELQCLCKKKSSTTKQPKPEATNPKPLCSLYNCRCYH